MGMNATNENNFDSIVLGAHVPVLLDVYADWCPPCRRMMPVVEQLATDLHGRAVVAKLDIEANQALAKRLGIDSLPTFIVFDQGKEVRRMVGMQTRDTLISSVSPTNSVG